MAKSRQAEMTIGQVITIVILAIFFFIVISVFSGNFSAFGKILHGQADSLGDCDNDLVQNLYDKCPCSTSSQPGDVSNKGCAPGYTIQNSEKGLEDKSCLTKPECIKK
ncbi:TPA: hypothetical protein HA372_03710 [Candidatus Woesearchaeota archaeon]|nr:MAG: hypothetical protein QT04_C0018G0008 [archaeon GW2011_AR11]HIH04633.1 hypothetical protein [Candidatus Woesearchaeota archaeon]HII64949.1 hypothetical protein [Candidatus Woesearchaeota archaeon]HIJ18765.1 hypothetical protein [Candidatus Woesearchaeota archaeon]